jgi:DNA-binding MarR family transcriptional regulator
MTELTSKEAAALRVFIKEGADAICADSAEELIADNMTFMDPTELAVALGASYQVAGGLITALSEKGLIEDTGEPLPERRHNAWAASVEGIRVGWNL